MPVAAILASSLAAIAGIAIDPANCAGATGDDIVVCGERDAPSPYRLPPPLPPDPEKKSSMSVSAKRNALFDYDAGGVASCSTVGSGGLYGCSYKQHKRAADQRAGAPDKRGWLWNGTDY